MKYLIFVFIILLAFVKAGIPAECRLHTKNRRYDPLECWLQSLQVRIPDQSFGHGVLSMDILNLKCTNFTIQGIKSQYYSNEEPSLELRVANVSAKCQGSYHSSSGLSGNLEANIAGQEQALRWTLSLQSSTNNAANIPMPSSVTSQNCTTTLAVTDLHFSGSGSATVIDIFRHSIRSYVSEEISKELCPLLAKNADPTLTKYLHDVDQYLEPYLQNETLLDTSIVAPQQEDMMPFLTASLSHLNQFVDTYLQKGFLRSLFPNVTCENDCGFWFDGVNGLLRSILPHAKLPIPHRLVHYHFLIPEYAEIDLRLHNTTILGVDQWEKFVVLQPNHSEFLSHFQSNGNIMLQSNVTLNVSAIDGGFFQGEPLLEQFVVSFNVSALDLLAVLSLEMNQTLWSNPNLTTGILMDVVEDQIIGNRSTGWQLPCLLEPLQRLKLSTFQANLQWSGASFVPRTSQDSLEQDLDGVLNTVLYLLLQEYPTLLSRAIGGLSRGPVQLALDEAMNYVIDHARGTTGCVVPDSTDDSHLPHLVDWTKTPLQTMNGILEQSRTIEVINQYLDCIGGFISEALKRELIGWTSQNSTFSLKVNDFGFKHMGSIRNLTLLYPENDHKVKSLLKYAASQESTLPELVVGLAFDYHSMNISGLLNISVVMNDLIVQGGSVIRYDSNRLRLVPLSRLLGHGQCVLSPVEEHELYDYRTSLGSFGLIINGTVIIGENKTFNVFLDSSEHASVEMVVVSAVEWAVNSTRDLLSIASASIITHADNVCEGSHSSDDHKTEGQSNRLPLLMLVVSIFVLLQPAALLIIKSPMKADDRSLTQPLLSRELECADPPESFSNISPRSDRLMDSVYVSSFFRHCVPIAIAGTIVLLLSSNLSVGATVDLIVKFDGETISFPSVFSFSLLETAKQMWDARIYPLLLLVVVFSGIWPYLKLFLMLSGWVIRGSVLPRKSRGTMLLALDSLGKFSLVDTYVLVLMVVAFRYHIDLAEDSTVDAFVTPRFGFYGFLVATALSMIIGHICIFYHRLSEIEVPSNLPPTEPLFEHAFYVGDCRKQLSRRFQLTVIIVLLLITFLLAFGITRKSFSFQFGGLAGLALRDEKSVAYSLLSLGASLSTSVKDDARLGIFFLQLIYYFYTVVTPFASMLFLIILLLYPMGMRRQLQFLTLVEVSNAWSAIEVFCLSIIASLFEISSFASFIIGNKCDILDEIVKDNFGELTCFTVRSFVSWDAAILVIGVLLHSFTVSMALRVAHVAMDERIHLERGSGHHLNLVQIVSSWKMSSGLFDNHDLSEPGPPFNGGECVPSPWKENGFKDEWRDAAEHDPAWKEWKEATSVT